MRCKMTSLSFCFLSLIDAAKVALFFRTANKNKHFFTILSKKLTIAHFLRLKRGVCNTIFIGRKD